MSVSLVDPITATNARIPRTIPSDQDQVDPAAASRAADSGDGCNSACLGEYLIEDFGGAAEAVAFAGAVVEF
ncbi:hypothetical protein ACIBJI_16625, partial [Nocardia sp. NPDC050408]|uniref:hypothetical protein n=1 Tax=Nocardia sp. NPDC050408 TaxID=3364319 RepID=UPI0037B8D35E